MKVLFIGGTGNISSACTKRALEKGMEVFHLNRGIRGSPWGSKVRTLKADIRDPASVRSAIAGMRFYSVVQFLAFNPDHVALDIDMLEGLTDQYVFISSCSAYKKDLLNPVVSESTPLENPHWEYSRLKIAGEQLLVEQAARRSFPYTIVRPSHTYDNGWIPTCFGSTDYGMAWRIKEGKRIIVPGDGQSIWTLTHASDFAVGLVGLLGNAAALGEAFHITSDERLTWDAIHILIGAALGVKPHIVHIPSDYIAKILPERGAGLKGDKAISVFFDNAKIKRFVPEFGQKTSFAEGIRRSIAWYDEHPDLKVPNQAINTEIDTILGYWDTATGLISR
jgi:nucleoside-diphosphate-sugar epimerase